MAKCRPAFPIFAVVLISACAGNFRTQNAPPLSAEETAQLSRKTVAEMVSEAEATVRKAHSAEFDFYAPGTLDRMERQLRDIQESGKNPDADKARLFAMTKAVEQNLQSGQSNKALVQSQLAGVLEQKQVIEKLNAAQLYPRDYKNSMESVIGLIRNIESGKPDNARSSTPSVMEDMRKLEIRIVKGVVLGRAAAFLAEARDKDAKEKARKTYEEASLAYDRAIKLIDTNPRDQEQIASLGGQATLLAQRCVRIAEEVAKLQEIKPKEMEVVVLEQERRMQRVAEALRQGDIRDQSLNNQSLALAKAAEKLYDQTDRQKNVTAELEQLKSDHSLAQEQIKRLAMDRKELQAKLDAIVTVPAARSQESAAGSASSAEAGSASADNKSQNGELPNQQDSTQAGGDK